jgi:transcriptional regulator with XRE-family HTH domain
MDDLRFGAAVRAARLNRQWSQARLAEVVKVSRSTVVRVELGRLEELSIGMIRRVARPLEIGVELQPRSRGALVERVVNARHSALGERAAAWLERADGWVVRPEVSFNIWGERGVIDLLAWHAATRTLLVIELKTAIVDVGEILATLGRKTRLARESCAPFGWDPVLVGVALIIGEGTTNHRRVAEHRRTFRAALPDDGHRLRAWLRVPAGQLRALTFMSDDRHRNIRSGFATLSRVPTRPGPRERRSGPPA